MAHKLLNLRKDRPGINSPFMDYSMRTIHSLFAGFALTLGLTSTAYAGLVNFDLKTPDSRNGIYNSTYAMQYNYEESGIDLQVTGWSYGIKTITTQTCTKTDRRGNCTKYKTTTTTALNEAIEQDYVGKWDGLGVEKTDSPNHAIDNEAGDFDMLLLSFDQLVTLKSLNLGWISGDSDVSILAFNGSSFTNANLLGKKWQDLIGNGWQSAGNYYNVDYGSNSGTVNLTNITSQYWLIGAYNGALGSFSGTNKDLSKKTDYFKLSGVTIDKPKPPVIVTESGSLLLIAIGLIGLGLSRRRHIQFTR